MIAVTAAPARRYTLAQHGIANPGVFICSGVARSLPLGVVMRTASVLFVSLCLASGVSLFACGASSDSTSGTAPTNESEATNGSSGDTGSGAATSSSSSSDSSSDISCSLNSQ